MATLLVNDLLFKTLWSGAWIPGKLSDLAWMTFAPPLLAFALSFATRRHPLTERGAFVTAYVGLPLLYAAFNTFAPVHDAIMRMLLLLSGAASGSPLDTADSLTIPVAMAVALWVWRRPIAAPSSVRVRLGLLAATAAVFATVATSPSPVALGITSVWVDPGGTVMAGAAHRYWSHDYFASKDGGLTWERLSDGVTKPPDQHEIETPRGGYHIEGSAVLLRAPVRPPIEVYSAAYLGNDANRWTQAQSIQERAHLLFASEWVLTTEPASIAYHTDTRNVIVAMGMQGVLLGTPDGQWHRISVGVYAPTDFSAQAKLRLLSGDILLWLLAIAVAAEVMSLALIFSFTRYRARDLVIGGSIGLLLALPLVLLAQSESDAAGYPESFGILFVPALFILTLPVLGTVRNDTCGKTLRLSMAVYALVALIQGYLSGFLVGFGDRESVFLFDRYTQIFLSIPAFLLTPTMAVVYASHLRERRVWLALSSGFAGGAVSTVLALLWWLMAGVSIAFSVAAAFALSGLITFVLVRYLGAMPQREDELPAMRERRTPAPVGHVVLTVVAAFFISPFIEGLFLVVALLFPVPDLLYGKMGSVASGVVTAALAAVLVAWSLVRIMALAPSGGPNGRRWKRWRIVLMAGLTLAGFAPAFWVWISLGYGGYSPVETLWMPGLIVTVLLPVVVALGLVRYLARLETSMEDDTPS